LPESHRNHHRTAEDPIMAQHVSRQPCQISLLFISIAGLAGCAAPLYQEPVSGPTAKIEFIDETPMPLSLHLHGGAKECTDRINMGGVKEKSTRTITIPAEQNLVFTVGVDSRSANVKTFALIGLGIGLRGSGYELRLIPCTDTECFKKRQVFVGCTPTIDFLPAAGRTYVFQMDSNEKDCNYQFYAKPVPGQAEQGLPQIAFSQRQWLRAFSEAGPFCKAK
jgi:hypothetical protein